MNRMLLLDSFSHLDETLLERSETAKPRAAWKTWTGLAACLALIAALTVPPLLAREAPASAGVASGTTELAPEPAPDVAPGSNAAMVPYPGEPATLLPALPMIASWPTDYEACYAAPKNGEAFFSLPLQEATDEYGDGARYRVIVDLFRDEQPLPADGEASAAERERLAALGYGVAYETITGEGERTRSYFTLHATYGQLADFPANGEYGYMLFLYGEREKGSSDDLYISVSRPMLSTGSVPQDSIEFPAPEPPEAP